MRNEKNASPQQTRLRQSGCVRQNSSAGVLQAYSAKSLLATESARNRDSVRECGGPPPLCQGGLCKASKSEGRKILRESMPDWKQLLIERRLAKAAEGCRTPRRFAHSNGYLDDGRGLA